MWITRISINNPVFATMVMVGIAVLGLFAYNRLQVEQMPDVSLPFVLVLTSYPGAAPEVVETDVTKPLEYAINQVSGVKLIRSQLARGPSQVFAEFRMTTDMTKAMQDVRDKIAMVRPSFPRDVKEPLVIRADNENQQPVVSLAVLSPTMGLRELTSLTDQTIVKALENVPGVARIDVNGRVTRQILIQIKPNALTALGIGVDQVISAIRAANQDVPAGRITRGQSDSVVRVEGKIKDPAQFARIIVAQQGGGPVYLSQVADVIDGEKEETSLRAHQRPPGDHASTSRKRRTRTSSRPAAASRAAVAALKDRLPADVEVRIANSTAEPVERSVNRVKQTIVEGALLTVLIVFLFLHSWRSTVITGLTLPICGDRDVHRAVRVRLHAQLPHADGAVAVHRPPDRRRDRRAREHRAPPGAGQGPPSRRRARHRRDRARGDGDDVRDRRRVRADRVHERHHRPLLLPVRRHRRRRRAASACSSASRSTRCSRRSGTIRRARASVACRWLGRFMERIERGIEWLHAIYGRDPRAGRSAIARA